MNAHTTTWTLNSFPPNIVTDGLVYYSDGGDMTSFVNNEPTTNLIAANGLDFTQMSSYGYLSRTQVADSSSPSGYACEMEILDAGEINNAARVRFGSDFTIPSSGNAAISVYVKFEGGTFSNIQPAMYNGTGTAWQYLLPLDGGSNYLTTEYRRFGLYTALTANPGFSMTKSNSNKQTGQITRWHSPQVELQTSATSFVSGSRPQNTLLNDLSGEGNTGTLTNGVSWNEEGYFDFDGVDDHGVLTTSLNLPGEFTVNCFFKQDTNGERSFLGRAEGSTKLIFLTGYNLFFRMVDNGSQNNFSIGNGSSLLGKWNFLTATRDSSGRLKGSLNGAPYTLGDVRTGNFQPNLIAKNNSGQYWNGGLQDMIIYNKSLSESEMLQNYYQAPIVTDGLVLALDAGNLVSYESGSTTTYSMTGSNSGTLTNGVGFDSNNGGGWAFDGVDDYISIADSEALRLNGNFTISFFLKAITKANSYPGPVYKGNSGSSGTGYIMFYTSITNGPLYYKRGNVQYALPNAVSTEWSYITFTYDGSNLKGYVNGELGLTSAVSFSTNTDATNLQLGRADNYGNQNIPNFSIYDRALTAEEVAQNYNAQSSRFQ